MQSAELLLSLLQRRANQEENFLFQRIYRNLYNQQLYSLVWEKPWNEHTWTDVTQRSWQEWLKQIQHEQWTPHRYVSEESCKEPDMMVWRILNLLWKAIFPIIEDTSVYIEEQQNELATPYAVKLYDFLLEASHGWMIPISISPNGWRNWTSITRLLSLRCKDGRFEELLRRFHVQGYFSPSSCSEDIQLLLHRAIDYCIWRSLGNDRACYRYVRIGSQRYLFVLDTIERAKESVHKLKFSLADLQMDNHLTIWDQKRKKELGPFLLRWNVSHQRWFMYLSEQEMRKRVRPFLVKNKPTHRKDRIYRPVWEIIHLYNKDLDDFDQNYQAAYLFPRQRQKFRYFHFQSLCKTIAAKEKCTVKQVIKRYGDHKVHGSFTLKASDGCIVYRYD